MEIWMYLNMSRLLVFVFFMLWYGSIWKTSSWNGEAYMSCVMGKPIPVRVDHHLVKWSNHYGQTLCTNIMVKGSIALLEETHFCTMPFQVLCFTVKTTTNLINWHLFLTCHLGATEEPEVIPDPAKQTDRVVKIAGISAGVLVFILLVLVAILLVKKRWVERCK